jgi:hypothetical protein
MYVVGENNTGYQVGHSENVRQSRPQMFIQKMLGKKASQTPGGRYRN